MSIRDAHLLLTAGGRPATIGNPTDFQPAPFPSGYAANTQTSVDFGSAMETGHGVYGLKARFTVVEAFATPADWRAFFCIIVARDGLLATGAQVIAQSGPNDGTTVGFLAAGLALNVVVELPVPKLDSLVRLSEAGFRYMGAGMCIKSPTSPATAGLVRAEFVLDSQAEQFLGYRSPNTAGFVVE
jgi:hypothetical protein